MSLKVGIEFTIFVLCLVIGVVSACRLDKMHKNTLTSFRLRYVLIGTGSLAVGLDPLLFPDQPRLGVLLFVAAICVYMLLGVPTWSKKAPDYTESDAVSLDPFDPKDTRDWWDKVWKK